MRPSFGSYIAAQAIEQQLRDLGQAGCSTAYQERVFPDTIVLGLSGVRFKYMPTLFEMVALPGIARIAYRPKTAKRFAEPSTIWPFGNSHQI